ncbi:uncharacterized protein [Battus philenor]|uniref:uncharacterized protein n=1 Tax=Battus philenor TaxID=42288 RepID=UPI0035D07FFB
MFETDDFDQVLSQLDLPELCPKSILTNCVGVKSNSSKIREGPTESFNYDVQSPSYDNKVKNIVNDKIKNEVENVQDLNLHSPKHCKRKIINSHFDSHCKRKFPGPAGILTGSLKEYEDEEISRVELLSQDIQFSQNTLQQGLFDSKLWRRLLIDINEWNLKSVETIETVKKLAIKGDQRCRKAKIITALIESIDRSAMDPMVTLRDLSGNIKCTLHRDAWSYFSSYMVPENAAIVLYKPTVLTTGSAYKKHYLNITLSNILAIYSNIVIEDEKELLPNGYEKVTIEDCTIIKTGKQISDFTTLINGNDVNNADFFEDLDTVFSDEMF